MRIKGTILAAALLVGVVGHAGAADENPIKTGFHLTSTLACTAPDRIFTALLIIKEHGRPATHGEFVAMQEDLASNTCALISLDTPVIFKQYLPSIGEAMISAKVNQKWEDWFVHITAVVVDKKQ